MEPEGFPSLKSVGKSSGLYLQNLYKVLRTSSGAVGYVPDDLLLGTAILPLRLEPGAREGKMNAVAELNEELKKPRVFKGISEVAVKIEQPPDDICWAPGHEPFTDAGKNIRREKCVVCGAEYFMAFSPIYRTKRTFEELSEELQLRLEEDHRLNRNHGSLVRLRWSERMRKRKRYKKRTNPHLESFSASPAGGIDSVPSLRSESIHMDRR